MRPPDSPTDAYASLTEREKETLRLIVRGHDAKSVARHLKLSVHTINERLRDARRKLSVSSSREAARLVLAREGTAPELLGDTRIGEALRPDAAQTPPMSDPGSRRTRRLAWIAIGVALMTLALGLLALALQPQTAAAPATSPPAPAAEATEPAVEAAARAWLTLVDEGKWEESYRAATFNRQNTLQVWTDVSRKVRAPLGAVKSRTLIGQENVPAPPTGYELVKFRTDFANKAGVVETLTLTREDGTWRVSGVTIG